MHYKTAEMHLKQKGDDTQYTMILIAVSLSAAECD